MVIGNKHKNKNYMFVLKFDIFMLADDSQQYEDKKKFHNKLAQRTRNAF